MHNYCTAIQGTMPLFFDFLIPMDDPIHDFLEVIDSLNILKYKNKAAKIKPGRPAYSFEDMFKTVLFGFMEEGYSSIRELENKCKTDVRYMMLMNGATPSYGTFHNFIREELSLSIKDIFNDINAYIIKADNVDLRCLYIDGTKIEANANRYSWVWKRRTDRTRYSLYRKITQLFNETNEFLMMHGLVIETSEDYSPEYLLEILSRLMKLYKANGIEFVSGKGRRKSIYQKTYQMLEMYTAKLFEYIEKAEICGKDRNSYSKVDPNATFMRMKNDYMKNGQLLPAYNLQFGVSDEYIVAFIVSQKRADMDCFIPLIEKYYETYGTYPEFPVADAGYGSLNNYIYCEEHGMKKYMKFPMYQKETHSKEYHENPYRAVNFKRDEAGNLVCPNGKKMNFSHRVSVKGNMYGRQSEVYVCEDCSNCPYAAECKKTDRNRTINLNEELTAYHKEVVENLTSIQGIILRMNRSIQSEGTFGIIKHDKEYKRTVRRGKEQVELEIFLVCIGFNLAKYHNKKKRALKNAS